MLLRALLRCRFCAARWNFQEPLALF